MARGVAEGHRVVTVFATNGEHGEVPDDLAPAETLVDRRRAEALASARVLGVEQVRWLGYSDSGMTGWDQNADEGSFHQAPLDEAAARLAGILTDERAALVVGYDWHGGYGHPDHVKVHHVVRRACELMADDRPRLLEATMNRDRVRRLMTMALAAGMDPGEGFDPDGPMDDGNPLGTPESELALQVDVTAYLSQRRAALECHRSQIGDIGGFLGMPAEAFAEFFGFDHYIEPGHEGPMRQGWILD
jgi:LmbE family N-acetylglucosaminyl deacetylase